MRMRDGRESFCDFFHFITEKKRKIMKVDTQQEDGNIPGRRTHPSLCVMLIVNKTPFLKMDPPIENHRERKTQIVQQCTSTIWYIDYIAIPKKTSFLNQKSPANATTT